VSLFSELRRRNVFRVAAAYVIVGWLLTEISTTVLPTFGAPDWIAKTLIFVVALAFIPVLIFAWAFEMTPEGIKREKDVVRDASITSRTGKKLDYVTIVAVVVGVAFLGFSKSKTDDPPPTVEVTETSVVPSVAVLPFVNMSGNAENEYFSDGLTETLLHMLAQVPEIKVAARTSSFAFKGQDQDVRKTALALGVEHILEGSVQRSGDKVRVTAQLIRADDGFHVWSSIYDRTLDDIFAIQDEIAADVGMSLTASLLGEHSIEIASIGTENVEAYDLFLQALNVRVGGSYRDLETAEELLKDALLLDANFLDAKAVLGVIYIQQQSTGLIDQEGAFVNAVALFEQVLGVRPDDVSTRASLVAIRALQSENDGAYMAIADAVPVLGELAAVAPNDVDLRSLYARFLDNVGRPVEAMAELDAALLIDPVNTELLYQLGSVQLRTEKWDAARSSFNRSLDINPDQPNVYGGLARLSMVIGDAVSVVENSINAMAIDSKDQELPANLAGFLYRMGLPDEADPYRDRAVLLAPNSPSARHAVLESSIARGDRETSDQLARGMVADDIDDRHGSYWEAVYTVLTNAVDNEDAEEGLQFIEQHQSGFNDPSSSTLSLKGRWAQTGAFAAWDAVYGREEASRMAGDFLNVLEARGFIVSDDPDTLMEILALRGDTDAAIDFALASTVNKPITTAIYLRGIYDAPHMAGVVADPRIQSRLQQWDEDVIKLRGEVKAFLDSERQ
jgi:TolB-like protein/Tfp pilus assembly protein PilF